MTVRDFINLQESGYDIGDKDFDAVVTCEYFEKIESNYDKFCVLLMSKVNLIEGGNEPVADWSGFVRKNLDEFKAFARGHWRYAYEDDEELIYQWVQEFHAYMAGMLNEGFYSTLVDFVSNLQPTTDQWIPVTEKLPPFNTMVRVKLTNGTYALDFVNEPFNKNMPFQHYFVESWRMPTSDELNAFMQKANR